MEKLNKNLVATSDTHFLTYDPIRAAWKAGKDHYQGNAGGGKSIIGKATTLADAMDEFGQRLLKTATFAIGGQSRSSERHTTTDNATVSQLTAGGNLIMKATQGGIISEGANLSAEGDFRALAKTHVIFDTARERFDATGKEKSTGHGIDTGKSLLKTLTLYQNKAREAGDKTTQKVTALSIGGSSFIHAETGDIKTYGTDMAVSGDNIFVAGGDVIFGSTQSVQNQERKATGRGIGSAEISDTERFYGYYQNKEGGYANQTVYKGSLIGSEKGNIRVYAGGKYLQESSALAAQDGKISISAKSVESIAHDNVSLTGNRSSDTKIGGFTKVSSPLIDLINTATSARNTLKDNKADDRMKAMKGALLAMQGYSAVSDLAQGVIARAEVGTGIKHAHSDYHEQDIRGQGNLLNGAKGVEVTAREGKIDFKQMDIMTTSYNAEIQQNAVNAGSYVYLDGKQGINLSSGRDEYHAKGRQSSYGIHAGVGTQVGAGTGAYAYLELGFTDSKQQTDLHNKQNSHIATERLLLKSGGDVNMKGASAYANRIDADIKGNLHIESEQSSAQSRSSATSVGGRVQVSFGTAWSLNGNFSRQKSMSNLNGVQEQSGLFAGDGGYHISAQNVHLQGGAITSTNPDNSKLATNRLTFADIHNESSAKVSSVSLAAGIGRGEERYIDKGTGKVLANNASATQKAQALHVAGERTTPLGIGLPLNSRSQDSTVTRATLTEGRIILNKDSQPTQTSAKALGLNTELSQAHTQVSEPNLDKLKEKQEIAALSSQLGAFAAGEIGKRMEWKEGSWQKTALHAAVGAASAKVSGGNVAVGATAGAASELINTQVADALANHTDLSPQARKSIQQLTATAIGATAGKLIGNNTNRTFQGANTALAAELYNRQLHPTEQERIKELAYQLAKEKGQDANFWEQQLTLVASALNDKKEAQIVTQGVEAILKDNVIYDLGAYQESLAVAYDVIKNEADKNQPIKWKDGNDVVLHGEKVYLFKSTEKQYKNSQLFGKINNPNIIQSPKTTDSLREIGYMNGLDLNASHKYSAELLGNIVEANTNRQDNGKLLRERYYHYVTAPKGIAEPVVWEDLLVGGGTFKLGSKAISTTEKALSRTGDTLAKAMVSNEALALSVVAESQLNKVLGKVTNSTVSYVENSFKAAANAPMKTTATNALAVGSAATVGEIYDYTKSDNPKALTKENVYSSLYSVGVETYKGALWGNMPLGASIAGNIATDKIATGNADVKKNVVTGISGSLFDESIKSQSSPFLREVSLKFVEKSWTDSTNSGENKK